MSLSPKAKEFLVRSLFGHTSTLPFEINELTLHVCKTGVDSSSTYAEVSSTHSLGSLQVASSTATAAAAFVWDATINLNSTSVSGGIENNAVLTVDITTSGTATHIGIVESDSQEVILVQAFTTPASYVVVSGDDIAFGAGSIQIEVD